MDKEWISDILYRNFEWISNVGYRMDGIISIVITMFWLASHMFFERQKNILKHK